MEKRLQRGPIAPVGIAFDDSRSGLAGESGRVVGTPVVNDHDAVGVIKCCSDHVGDCRRLVVRGDADHDRRRGRTVTILDDSCRHEVVVETALAPGKVDALASFGLKNKSFEVNCPGVGGHVLLECLVVGIRDRRVDWCRTSPAGEPNRLCLRMTVVNYDMCVATLLSP